MEAPEIAGPARFDPQGFLERRAGDLIIDEYRRVPELMGSLRAAALNMKKPGQLVLLTSHLPFKMGFAQPFAKHPAMQIIMPFTISELHKADFRCGRDGYIYRGFMPRAYRGRETDPAPVYRGYGDLCAEQNVRHLAEVDDPAAFRRFLTLLAGRIGQIINPSALANDARVPQATLVKWMHALEASFVIFRLPSYFDGFGNRMTKIPKLYFTDVGMATHLMGIESAGQVFRDPMVGNLFENMVVAEVLKHRYNMGQNADLYYYRSQSNLEIDLIMDKRHCIIPIEIKSAAQFDASFAENIKRFRKLSSHIKNGYIIYGGETMQRNRMPEFINFKEAGRLARW
jgi:predicted AAA+ superfamily ATPase